MSAGATVAGRGSYRPPVRPATVAATVAQPQSATVSHSHEIRESSRSEVASTVAQDQPQSGVSTVAATVAGPWLEINSQPRSNTPLNTPRTPAMTTTLDAPADPPPVTCRACGRPVHAPLSRLLRLGAHCRNGLNEHQLLTALTTGVTA